MGNTIPLPAPSSLPEMPKDEPKPEQPNLDEILMAFELRIQSLEAALLRIRGAI